MEETNFREEGGIFSFPKLQPVRFFLNYDPPQIGLLYKRTPKEKKKHLFLIQLNGVILLGDPDQITHVLFDKYPAFLNEKIVSPNQIHNLVSRMLEYIQKVFLEQNENDEEEGN